MSLSDGEIKELLEKAKSYRKRGEEAQGDDLPDLEQELNCYNKIIQNAAPHAHFFSERAEVKFRIMSRMGHFDSFDGVFEDASRAIELDPQRGYHYRCRGFYLWSKLEEESIPDNEKKNKLFENVIADHKACLSREPTNTMAWLSLIAIYIVLRQWDEAISIYGSCKPYVDAKEDRVLRSWLGCLALTLAGDPLEQEDKRELLDQTIHIQVLFSGVVFVCSFLREILLESGYREKSGKIDELNGLLIAHYVKWDFKQAILRRLGRYEEALKACEKAIEMDRNFARAWGNKRWILEKLGRHEDALKVCDRIIALKPSDAEGWGSKSYHLGELKRHEEALKACDKAIELDPDHAYAWNNKGWNLGELGRHEEAIKALDKAIQLDPNHVRAWGNKRWILEKLGRHEDALKVCDRIIALKPSDAGGWVDKSHHLAQLGRHVEALKACDKAIELDPNHPVAWKNKHWILERLGRH